MQKAQCPVFAKGLCTVRYFHSQHFLYLPSFFPWSASFCSPHHPANTFKRMESQLMKEAYNSLLDSGSYVLLNKIITFIRIGVDSYILQNFRAPNDT